MLGLSPPRILQLLASIAGTSLMGQQPWDSCRPLNHALPGDHVVTIPAEPLRDRASRAPTHHEVAPLRSAQTGLVSLRGRGYRFMPPAEPIATGILRGPTSRMALPVKDHVSLKDGSSKKGFFCRLNPSRAH
jgi:hypothetical protein